MKQKMSIKEADRNSREMVVTAKPGDDVEHFRQINEAIEDADFDRLGDIIEEGAKSEYKS